jgi:WD40 repeat protein
MNLVLSKDNKLLFAGGSAGTVRVYDLEKNKLVKTFKNKGNSCNILALSADEKRLAVGYVNGTIELYDLKSGKSEKILRGGTETLYYLFFIENDQQLVSMDGSFCTRFWNLATGVCTQTVEESGEKPCFTNISPNGQLIVRCDNDGRARVRQLATGEKLKSFGSSDNPIIQAYFSADNQFLLTNDYECTVKLWSLETGDLLKICRVENGAPFVISVSNDRNWLAMSHQDFTISIWCLKDDLSQKTVMSTATFAHGFTLTKDEKQLLLSNGESCSVDLVALDGTLVKTYHKSEDTIFYTALTPDNQYVLSGGSDEILYIHDFKTGKLIKKVKDFIGSIESTYFTSDGKKCVALNQLVNHIDLVEFPSFKVLKTFEGPEITFSKMIFTPDDQFLLTISYDSLVRLWSLETGAVVRTYGRSSEKDLQPINVEAVAVCPNKRWVAAALGNYDIELYDFETSQLKHVLRGHQNCVSSLVFTADSQFLLTGCGDKTVKLWSIATATPLKTFVGHKDPISNLTLLSDNQHFISIDEKGVIKHWSFADAIEENIATFPLYEMMDWQFQIETDDFQQYLDELAAAINPTSFSKEDAVFKVQTQLRDPALIEVALRRLGAI